MNGPDFVELSLTSNSGFGEGGFGEGGFGGVGETFNLDDEINSGTIWTEVDES